MEEEKRGGDMYAWRVGLSRWGWDLGFNWLRSKFKKEYPKCMDDILVSDQKYGDHALENVQIFEPSTKTNKRSTCMIFVHGGGWMCGKKEWYTEFMSPFLRKNPSDKGVDVIFSADYPLAPEDKFPGRIFSIFQFDFKAAPFSILKLMLWIKSKYPELENDFVVMGDSAGANIAIVAVILACNPSLIEYLGNSELSKQKFPTIKKMISLYGAMTRESAKNFPNGSQLMKNYAGKHALDSTLDPKNSFMPVDLEFTNFPESLVCVGTSDYLYSSSIEFANFLKKKDEKKVFVKEYEGEDHGLLNRIWRPNCKLMIQDVANFITI